MNTSVYKLATALVVVFIATGSLKAAVKSSGSWTEALLAGRVRVAQANTSQEQKAAEAQRLWFELKEQFPVQWDWLLQDSGGDFFQWFSAPNPIELEQHITQRAISQLGDAGRALQEQLEALVRKQGSKSNSLLGLYATACEQRRRLRLATVLANTPGIIFTKHHTLRPSFFAYTEGQSDAQNERHFIPGSELCLLELDGCYGQVRSLVSDPTGAIRDPAVSWDGQRVLFAWKKSLDTDDYHVYELNVASNQVRQITSGLGFADYEPAWLPNGDIIFASTRCVQTVDCWWTEVSNLYTCDAEGRYLRRLTFDQVHSIYPQVLDDGRVVYTRWD